MSALILYRTDDGQTEINLRSLAGSVWLGQMEMVELFATSTQNVSLHNANILKESELAADSVVKASLTTAAGCKTYRTKLFSLPLILAVGFRVRSPRGTQLRQRARRCLTGACPNTRIACSLRANTTRHCCTRRPFLKPTGYFFVPSHTEAQS